MRTLLIAALLSSTALAQDFHLDQLVDKNTFLFGRIANPGALARGIEGSKLYKLYTCEPLRKFMASIKTPDGEAERGIQSFFQGPQELEKELGKTWLQALAGIGEIALAMPTLSLDGRVPDLVFTMDLKGDAKLEAFILKQIEKAGAKPGQRTKVEGVELTNYNQVWIGKIKTVLFCASTEQAAKGLIAAVAKPPAEPLASSEMYRHARKAVADPDDGVFYFINASMIVREIEKQAGEPAVRALLDALGVSGLTYAALSNSLENGQVVLRGHLNADLKADPKPIDPAIFDKKPSEIEGKVFSLGFSNVGETVKMLFKSIVPALEMGARENNVQMDLKEFPIQVVADLAGTAQDVFITIPSGIAFYSRSDVGFSPSMFGGSSVMTLPLMAAVLLPAITRSVSVAKDTQCNSNLRQMAAMVERYRLEKGRLPNAEGKAFWKEIVEVAGGGSMDVLTCPHARKRKGAICYRGPTGNGEILGCDDPDNHLNGIHVLSKDGQVTWAFKGTPEYDKALRGTKE